jgi:hypothetical protein
MLAPLAVQGVGRSCLLHSIPVTKALEASLPTKCA